jgi:acetolactate synthase I/II/III large subunit
MSTQIRGAEVVIKSLIAEGTHTVFGYPGGAIMPIYDAMYDYRDTFKHILVRHEQGGIHAAQGMARSSRTVGVCFATSGPGATNLVTGLADAMIDSTPLVCITGQVASHLLGTDAFQETDVIGITMPVTKWSIQITKASEIQAAIAKAFYIAKSGRPGPVLIDITKDAQFGMTEFDYEFCTEIRSYNPMPTLKVDALKEAAKLINSAKKPYLLIGQGILLSGAEQELLAFVEKSGIPVASTLLGLGAFSPDHRLYAGYLGMHGNYGPNIKTNDCDVLIAVGMRFDDRVTGDLSKYAKQAKVIHIDIDKSELNKNVPAEIAIHSDAKGALAELTKWVDANSHDAWLQEFKECDKIEQEMVINEAVNPVGNELKMAEVMNKLSEKTNGKAIVVTDVGQHQMITSRYYKYKKNIGNITSGGLGTMGFALPAAIGAKVGAPSEEVIAIIGDGGFQMTIQELGTILQSKIGVKIIVLNNNFLGMVRQWQQLFFEKRYSGTEIENPDFVAIAKGYGIESAKVSERGDIDAALDTMLNHKGAYFLEVVVEQEENVFPMIETGAAVSDIRLN